MTILLPECAPKQRATFAIKFEATDIVAFLRATSLSSIQGADGLRRLHEELSDRASIRSEKRVKEFIIETIVVQ